MGDVDDLVVLRSGDEDALAEEITMRSEVVTQGEVEDFAHGDDSKHHGAGLSGWGSKRTRAACGHGLDAPVSVVAGLLAGRSL